MSDRYQIVDESQSAHCCFECTVVDTQRKAGPGASGEFVAVCETFDRESADLIAAALNKHARNYIWRTA